MSVFNKVGGIHPRRSMFNLSYEKKFNADMGQLIPIMADEVVPGDIFKMSNQVVIRFQPLVAPVLHEINAYVHYFFVPTRLIMDDWEDFISGGSTGESTVSLPFWEPTNKSMYSLWDYFGFPIDVDPKGAYPLAFPKRAYNLIYNNYYRDENLQDEVDLDQENVLNRCWEKDYFTSALPWQQRGTAPALPISGTTSAVWDTASNLYIGGNSSDAYLKPRVSNSSDTSVVLSSYTSNGSPIQLPLSYMNSNTVDLGNATTFDVADLRLAFQIQKWLERNARGGVRYTEFLRSHFGVSPRDERLQRPEYIGGSKSPVVISEVLQTSNTDEVSPQGNLAGHGITADQSRINSYRATEFGYIIGIMSVMPRTAYSQGIDRQWLRRTKYDFYFPEFAHLSEQAIETAEIYATDTESTNTEIFGYQGRYNEMRYKRNMICGGLRTTFDYWHLGREFDNTPLLNADFIECKPEYTKRIFAVQDEPGLICDVGNIINAFRPLPISAEPGLIDHN